MAQTQPFRLKILVVDDDEEVLAVTSGLLEAEGYAVLTAASAREALAMIESNRDIALLFTDIVLPGPIDGFTLAETAKLRLPGLRVVYTSGYLRNERTWDEPFLPKPWTEADLKNAISEVCGMGPPTGTRKH